MPKGQGSGGAAAATEKQRRRAGQMHEKTMLAAAIDRFGPPEVLTLHTLPVQKPGPGEVLVALHSAGVGSWDAKIRDGSWATHKKFPLVPGADGAGFIAEKGARVRDLKEGDRVWAMHYENPRGGFYAEYVTVDAADVALAPKQLSLPEAAAAVVTGLTALQGIDDILHVENGETVLVFGASGGVGSIAVQFAKLRGARVIATATGRNATRFVRDLGADEVFDARSADALEQLRALAPEGLDAVLALAGGTGLERCLGLVRPGGRIAYPNGVEPVPVKRRTATLKAYNGEAGPAQFERLGFAVEEAGFKVPIAATFTLEQAAEAHERLEQGHVLGRIVLQIRP